MRFYLGLRNYSLQPTLNSLYFSFVFDLWKNSVSITLVVKQMRSDFQIVISLMWPSMWKKLKFTSYISISEIQNSNCSLTKSFVSGQREKERYGQFGSLGDILAGSLLSGYLGDVQGLYGFCHTLAQELLFPIWWNLSSGTGQSRPFLILSCIRMKAMDLHLQSGLLWLF